MRSIDGVEITHGLRVWDYDLNRGSVDLEYDGGVHAETNQNNGHVEHWFYVKRDKDGFHKMMSESRVWSRHPSTGQRA